MAYCSGVAYVVLCGPSQGPPDSIVGPFDSLDAANEYAQAQAGDPEQRFAAVMPLAAPELSECESREVDAAATQQETDAELGGEA